jgi:predicted pyridoxine 5'-phosphate oxidase superfamily flavin-nucleotide-binding protein
LLTSDMKRVVEEQRLGFVATVCADGTPNLSPQWTVTVLDDAHLVFADVCSPQTIDNLKNRPAIEVGVVDPVVRKGYRFKGQAEVHASGPPFDEAVARFRQRGVVNSIRSVVVVTIESARPVASPDYDLGLSEAEVSRRWESHWSELRTRRQARPAAEKARR